MYYLFLMFVLRILELIVLFVFYMCIFYANQNYLKSHCVHLCYVHVNMYMYVFSINPAGIVNLINVCRYY